MSNMGDRWCQVRVGSQPALSSDPPKISSIMERRAMSLLLSTDRLLCVEMLCLLVLLAELLPGSDKRRLTRTRLGS